MDTANLNSGIQKDLSKITDKHIDFEGSMDAIEDKFSEIKEDLQNAGESIMMHLKDNRQRYLMVAAGALVLGGAFLLFQRYGTDTLGPVASGRKAKGKQQVNSKVH